MAARVIHVRQACELPPDDRTEEQILDIVEFVKDVKIFSGLKPLEQQSLCRRITLEKFQAEETICKLGERGEELYIILSGSVRVQTHVQAPCPNNIPAHAEKCDCPDRPLETTVFLGRGAGFGELALHSNAPRSASIVAAENTELLVVTRSNYEKYAGMLHRQFIEQRVRFLRQCPRIEDALQRSLVTSNDVALMANSLNEYSLTGSEIIVRQGQPVEHMIFVRSGQLAMLRAVDTEKAREDRQATLKARSVSRTVGGNPADPSNRRPTFTDAILPQEQSQAQLATNLAKAMLALKKEDREQRSTALLQKDQAAANAAAAKAATDARRTSTDSPPVEERAAGAPSDKPLSGVGKQWWGKLKQGFMQAKFIKELSSGKSQQDREEAKKQDAMANLNKFTEVQAARRVYTNMQTKELRQKRKHIVTRGASRRKVTGSNMEGHITTGRSVLLRIGTISPFQYFGDQQIGANQAYPVSLVSDPVAEIYMMTKNDILRRLPRKMFSALFEPQGDSVPSDVQLMDMHRQSLRWDAFRRSLQRDALSTGRAAGLDGAANLEFLGIAKEEEREPSPTRMQNAALTLKDQEHFSGTSARFLRRFNAMREDPKLRRALAKAGLDRRKMLSDSLDDSVDETDPMKFHFDLHWSKMRKDPIGLDTTLDVPKAAEAAAVRKTSAGTGAAGSGGSGGDPSRSSLLFAGASMAATPRSSDATRQPPEETPSSRTGAAFGGELPGSLSEDVSPPGEPLGGLGKRMSSALPSAISTSGPTLSKSTRTKTVGFKISE